MDASLLRLSTTRARRLLALHLDADLRCPGVRNFSTVYFLFSSYRRVAPKGMVVFFDDGGVSRGVIHQDELRITTLLLIVTNAHVARPFALLRTRFVRTSTSMT